MASTTTKRPTSQAAGSFGDYIPDDFADFGDLFSDDEPSGADANSASTKAQQTKGDSTAGLGIDEEVEVKKKAREPRVKLDQSRLLSAKGIPALRKQARILKLKGKGHEFSDASRLLSMYQLWLDDLFPKARFSDALVMIEKEGHKTGMHKMRMEWINESKPKDPEDNLDDATILSTTQRPSDSRQQPQQQQQQPHTSNDGLDSIPDDLFDDDLYDATPAPPAQGARVQGVGNPDLDQVPDESELDALMAEAMEVHGPDDYQPPPMQMPDDDFDDLDALIAEAEAEAPT
ncbi:Antiviral helicase ski2 [Sporothrix eucalyptigena]|uniref:Chromosome segregation in meiosis protein n=1 Tax=Sporothrix eucalyptigena TaxID=1812306 RepID=A0ABP0CAV5_9PEZI